MKKQVRIFLLLFRWQLLRLRTLIPLFIVLQMMTGVGFIIGLNYLVPNMDQQTAYLFVSGAPTLILIIIGVVFVPQIVTEDIASGSLAYMFSLPISRILFLLTDLFVWLLSALPGIISALWIGSWYYDFSFSIEWLLWPSILIVGLTCCCMGYAIAHLIAKPQYVLMLTNLVVFFLFLFTPINFPLERLPSVIQALHLKLPFIHMADLIRQSINGENQFITHQTVIMLSIWLTLSFGIMIIVVQRRR
ncbi:ABC-2 type transport system permease protein [Amphibacillus marinus]|uniref:ABC-2 type transport system permease protein n=1 Tax=Amphibacillus marinus TaxID=872970 RepID=A0A1H8Q5R7_9BACI|nr:ABC transporter permease [Amphibacillus marinus]SEO49602.1 ABC-2 type transport system permease protein [Amphibacillus marinus]